MEKFKKAIGSAEKVWFEIEDKDKKAFLEYAKSIGCTWLDGDEIIPEKHGCNYHMSIHADFKIASVAYFVWFSSFFKDVKKLAFADFKNGEERIL